MNWVKENGGLIGLIGIASVAVGIFAELRIRQHLDSMNIPSDDRISAFEEKLNEQKIVHKDDRDRMDSKIERIVDILLEE